MNPRDKMICEKIKGYCTDIKRTHESFEDKKDLFYSEEEGFIYRNAVAMPVLQIGELAKNLTEDFEQECPNVTWKNFMRMRDVLAHHYVKLDKDILWETTHEEIDNMYVELDRLLMIDKK